MGGFEGNVIMEDVGEMEQPNESEEELVNVEGLEDN